MIDYADQNLDDLRKLITRNHLKHLIIRVSIKVLAITVIALILMRSF